MKLFFWFIRRTLPYWWILAALTILICKLIGVINWSWWWVTFPAYLPVLLVFVLPGSALLFVIVFSLFKSFR